MSECLCPCYVCGEMEPLESMKFHNGFCSCDSVDGCTHGVCKDCVQECSDQEPACEICMGESAEIEDCEACCRPVCKVCSEDVGGWVICQACIGGTDLIEKLQSENAALRAQVERLEAEKLRLREVVNRRLKETEGDECCSRCKVTWHSLAAVLRETDVDNKQQPKGATQ